MNITFSQTSYFLRQATQGLRKKAGFVSSVVITMGVVLGALLCVSTLTYLLLVKPLPYKEQERLYRVDHILVGDDGNRQIPAFTYPGIMHLYKNQDVFSETALISYGDDVISSAPSQPMVEIGYITPGWFPLYDATFVLGRGFGPTEAANTNHPVAILSYQTWSREFGEDIDILSKSVSISGIQYRVVGVVADSFREPQIHGIDNSTGVWLPWDFNFGKKWSDEWRKFTSSLTFVGKLKPDINASQARQSIEPLVNNEWQQNVSDFEHFKGSHIELEFLSFRSIILGDSQDAIYLLLAGVLGLLVIAYTNIANLFMSRTAEQQQSLAIHAALGAKKNQLFYALFAESGLLMIISVGLAIVIASLGFLLIQEKLSTVVPRVSELGIDMFMVSVALIMATFFAYLFARISRGMIKYDALNSMLQSSGKGTGVQVSKRYRKILITSQIAVATVLVFVNISLLQSSVETITQPLGFKLDNTTYLTLSYGGRKRPPLKELVPIMREVRNKIIRLPEVKSISQSYSPLFETQFQQVSFGDSDEKLYVQTKGVDSDYFKLIKQNLLEGDYFSPTIFTDEVQDEEQYGIINDVLAKKIAPNGSSLGNVRVGDGKTVKVIGVVKGIKKPGESGVPYRYYFPLHSGVSAFVIELHDHQTMKRETVGKLLREISGLWSVWKLESLNDNAGKRLFAQTTTAVTTAVITLLTFFLAGVGLYGILSYTTQMRRFEIGTRMAIGAKGKDLIRLVISDYFRAIFAGIAVGVSVLFIFFYILNDQIQEFYSELYSGQSVINLLATLILIITIGLYACYVPLRQYINKPVINSLRGSE